MPDVKFTKDTEVIIRTEADKKRLEELIAAGWKVYAQGYMISDDERTRAFFKLSKEDQEDSTT